MAASSSSFHGTFQAFAILALGVGVIGACGMVWASVNLLGATHLAMLNMNDDAELIYARERARMAKA